MLLAVSVFLWTIVRISFLSVGRVRVLEGPVRILSPFITDLLWLFFNLAAITA